MLDALFRLVPALLRHLLAYGELLGDEAAEAARALHRRLLGTLVLLLAGELALLMGCACVIAATWDGPHRVHAVGALCAGFAVIALCGLWYASRGIPAGQPRPFERLVVEWREDMRQLSALYPSPSGAERAAGVASAELRVD